MTNNKLYLIACFTMYAVLFYSNWIVASVVLAIDLGFSYYKYPFMFKFLKRNQNESTAA